MKGIDYTYRQPKDKLKRLASEGVSAVGRYVAPTSFKKTITADEVKEIHAAGLGLWLVFETDPTHAGYFTQAQAKKDADLTSKVLSNIGAPQGQVVYFAVDYDATYADFRSNVLPYFSELKKQAQGFEVGVYGSAMICSNLRATVDHAWQTYAWSGGATLDFAEVYQHKNGATVAGITCDLDAINDPSVLWGPPGKALATPRREVSGLTIDFVVPNADKSHKPVARHFQLHEFACPTCGMVRVTEGFLELVSRLDALREEAGHAVVVKSGYRCPEHNKQIGGASG